MRKGKLLRILMASLLAAPLVLVGCSGDDGSDGTNGANGTNGLSSLTAVTPEPAGDNCEFGGQKIDVGLDDNGDGVLDAAEVDSTSYVCNGENAVAAGTQEACSICHGVDRPFSVATYMDVNDYPPNFGVEITNVALVDNGAGGLVVSFTVTDGNGGTPSAAALATATSGAKVAVAKLVPSAANADLVTWQDYYNSDAAADGPKDAAGNVIDPVMASAIQATGATCVLAEVNPGAGDGLYTCTDTTDLTAVATPLAVTWAPTLTHRVAIYFGSHVAAPAYPGNGWVDLVPQTLIDGGTFADAQAAVVDTRDIATTASCDECHGVLHGHGGDRVEVAICVVCHNPGTTDPDSGLSMDMAAMIHSIHLGDRGGAAAAAEGDNVIAAGTAHPTVSGENGAVLRAEDYVVGHRGNNNDFTEIGYPNRLDNCSKCHTAADAATPDGDDYMAVPSTLACVSCHDGTDWATSHAGRGDNTCTFCHSGTFSVASTHAFVTTPYVTTITLEADGNGDGVYEEGDAPLITITVKDGSGADVGGYTDADYNATDNPTGHYNDARVYIYGPRSKSAPVLATGTQNDPAFVAELALDPEATPSQSHELYVGGDDPLVMTDASGFKYQTLAIPEGMTPGTYMIMARIGVGSDSSARAWALKTFQINTATEQLKVAGGGTRDNPSPAGGCESCHDLRDYSSTAHRAFFGTDGCLACHDQSGNHADPITNRVHAVHSASAFGDLVISREWTDITYPQVASHCKACHTSGNNSFQSNPIGIACVGCHGDTPDSKDHMVQMGANFPESFLMEQP